MKMARGQGGEQRQFRKLESLTINCLHKKSVELGEYYKIQGPRWHQQTAPHEPRRALLTTQTLGHY